MRALVVLWDGDDLRVPFRRQHSERWQLHLLLVVPETRYQTMAHLPAWIRPLPANTGTPMDTFQNRVMQRCRSGLAKPLRHSCPQVHEPTARPGRYDDARVSE